MARGGARLRGCGRAGIPTGDRKKTHRRRRARRAAKARRREVHGPRNGCVRGLGRAADVQGARCSRGRRTPRRPIWRDQAGLNCPI